MRNRGAAVLVLAAALFFGGCLSIPTIIQVKNLEDNYRALKKRVDTLEVKLARKDTTAWKAN